jgi:anti-anti-sigma regulatory factor
VIDFIEEVEGKVGTLRLEGDITIQLAEEFKEALTRGIGCVDKLCVDSSKVTLIDLSGLQLLCAAHRAAMTMGKSFELAEPVPAGFRISAESAGFARHTGCRLDATETCVWSGLFNRHAAVS